MGCILSRWVTSDDFEADPYRVRVVGFEPPNVPPNSVRRVESMARSYKKEMGASNPFAGEVLLTQGKPDKSLSGLPLMTKGGPQRSSRRRTLFRSSEWTDW